MSDDKVKRGRHLSNTQNPCSFDLEQQHLDWINENVIGRPKATKNYTIEAMGMIGIYAKSE